ncbi:GMC family oxidoreductase [bacterium]|nr:MAG: GMC family oxidoreductase [bacterium]
MTRYDAIVVGAGAGGGVAANVLAQRGFRVLILEQGPWLDFATSGRDHLRNHRLPQYGDNTGLKPEENPRVFVDGTGNPHIVLSYQGGFNHNATAVGSGTFLYGAQAWRFHPYDLQMASVYGVPEGSSLADWPIGYEDLVPWYERVEDEIGVCGSPPAEEMPARREYPMPPTALPEKGRRLQEAAKGLGWSTQRVPLLINSVPHDGRAACVNCQHCVGFACPVDAKNGTQNTAIPRALATGNATLLTEASVLRVNLVDGRATGVTYVKDGVETNVEAPVVVVAGGAIESARLLLLSGVESDHLGRHLQGHYYHGAHGIFPDEVWDGIGPGASVATLRFNHGNEEVIGGAMMADDFIATPISFAKGSRPVGIPGWGQAHKEWMRHAYPRFVTASGPVQEIPSPTSRVSLDPWVTDSLGRPVARLSGTTHPETIRTSLFINARGAEWLRAAGCETVWVNEPVLRLSGGQHQSGTCRMGDDPTTSVVDRNGKVHGIEGLYVADGSVHVTNGGFNPVLTIMALAMRTASAIPDV